MTEKRPPGCEKRPPATKDASHAPHGPPPSRSARPGRGLPSAGRQPVSPASAGPWRRRRREGYERTPVPPPCPRRIPAEPLRAGASLWAEKRGRGSAVGPCATETPVRTHRPGQIERVPGRYPGRYRPFRAGSAEVCTCSAGADAFTVSCQGAASAYLSSGTPPSTTHPCAARSLLSLSSPRLTPLIGYRSPPHTTHPPHPRSALSLSSTCHHLLHISILSRCGLANSRTAAPAARWTATCRPR